MSLAIYVMHVPGTRDEQLKKLLERVPLALVMGDPNRKGAWWNARRCWQDGIELEADWIVVLNDDALPCEGFAEVAEKALAARDPRDPVCFYTAHPKAAEVLPAHWYTTHDDLVGVGCALSRQSAIEFLEWVDRNPGMSDFSDDGQINLWAMATGLLIHTTVPSLVDHQLPDESMVTWSSPDARTAVVPPTEEMRYIDWTGRASHLGRKRHGNHWELLHRAARVDVELIERAYAVERHGAPVSKGLHVFIAMPAYVTPEAAVRVSVQNAVMDLREHGIEATYFETPGDSLVTRGRHGLMHEFLRSTATHLLQWDADVECLDPTAVRKMVESGYDVVGGAYPWRDGSGRVVVNPLPDTVRDQHVDIDSRTHCIKVSEVGTGFMLTSRKCILRLCDRHPTLMYQADIEPYVGAPMWALFDAAIEYHPATGRRRYASEDWRFCTLAREAGYDVVVYYPPVFRHWGKKAHEGHITKAWGMNTREAAE